MDSLAPGWVPVLLLFMTSLTILSSVLCVVSTTPCFCQSLVLFGSCVRSAVRGLFWEMTSGYVVFSASWFDSVCMVTASQRVFRVYCFRVLRNA